MKHARIALLVIGVVLVSQAAAAAATPAPAVAPSAAAAVPVCNGKYKGRLKPSPAELAEILKQHLEWLKAEGPEDFKLANDPRRANLCGANLMYADLGGAHLRGANLTGADLKAAHLTQADLSVATLSGAALGAADLYRADLYGADLKAANLEFAHLVKADLIGADLSGAALYGADLTGADLTRAHLTGADLTGGARLIGADLSEAQVSRAKLAGVDLTAAIYAPMSEPPDPYVARIKGLATFSAARGGEIGLIQLRKLLQDAGLSNNVREATFSIQHNITRGQLSSQFPNPAWIEGILRVVGLEWTTAYGLHPERALRWILLLGAVLTSV